MIIIQKHPNPSGAYPAPQSWNSNVPPSGYAIISLDMTEFYNYNGFVTLTIEGDTVTEYTPNVDAWEEWQSNLPEPTDPEPTLDDRVTVLEAQVAQADDTAIELYEMQLAQEQINAAQDDALVEIYEMIGG